MGIVYEYRRGVQYMGVVYGYMGTRERYHVICISNNSGYDKNDNQESRHYFVQLKY